MEEMQEALKGKTQSDGLDCMLSEPECSFSTDSLDDRAIRDESSQRDSSTMISEFSSTRTLMNIDDEGKRCFEEEELSPKGFFLSRRHSDSMDVEQEVSTMEYSWEMTVSDREKASQRKEMSQENFEDELEVKDILVNKRLNEKMRYEKGKEMRRKISEEKSVAKKGAEAKLSTTVTVKVKREVSAKSLSSEKKTRVSKSPRVRKSPSHSPMRTTGSVVDSDISMKRSPSPKGAKHLKAHESPLNDRQKNMKVKPSSLSPTSSDKSEQLTSTTKLTGSKFVRGNRLKEETSENVVTRVKENVDTKLEEGKGSINGITEDRKEKKDCVRLQ